MAGESEATRCHLCKEEKHGVRICVCAIDTVNLLFHLRAPVVSLMARDI